ncbi:hypothetical protein GF319_13400 [Candidatus Bathyarchaeota archaeon]|nr:hypothetical protein [Candidatus Bathyarchaeota archaeon]
MKDSDQVYWIKAAVAVLTGALSMLVSNYTNNETMGVIVGIAVFFAVSEILSLVKKIDRNRTMRIAVGAFLFLWIFSWTLLNTLARIL